MPDLQAVITMLEERILKLEGRSFALTSTVKTLICDDPSMAPKFKQYLVASQGTFEGAIKSAPDKATETFVRAASELVSELLAEEANFAAPRLEVIPGGKSGD